MLVEGIFQSGITVTSSVLKDKESNMAEPAVRVRCYWWPNDDAPADSIQATEKKARGLATEFTTRAKGKAELFAGDKYPPFAVYEGGAQVYTDDRYSPANLSAAMDKAFAKANAPMLEA